MILGAVSSSLFSLEDNWAGTTTPRSPDLSLNRHIRDQLFQAFSLTSHWPIKDPSMTNVRNLLQISWRPHLPSASRARFSPPENEPLRWRPRRISTSLPQGRCAFAQSVGNHSIKVPPQPLHQAASPSNTHDDAQTHRMPDTRNTVNARLPQS